MIATPKQFSDIAPGKEIDGRPMNVFNDVPSGDYWTGGYSSFSSLAARLDALALRRTLLSPIHADRQDWKVLDDGC